MSKDKYGESHSPDRLKKMKSTSNLNPTLSSSLVYQPPLFQTDYHLDGFKREEFDDFSDLEEDLLRDFECFSDEEFEFNAQNDATNLVQNKLYNTSATLDK